MSGSEKAAAIAGLVIAWGGTALLASHEGAFLNDSASIALKCLGQAVLWLFLASILLIVVFWEKQRLRSLWLKPFRWQSFAWGGALFLAYYLLFFPVSEWLRKALGLAGYAAGMEKLADLPIWFRIIAVITAGVVEEILLRAYTITRFAQLSGSLSLAAVISVIAFAALHIPVWGIGPSFAILVSGAAMTGFFVWKRDLLSMILAHTAIDAWGLVIALSLSEWWK